MVQLRKSRKSFRKIRGRKTRQRKNEKRKSRKTRSTRKTGGLGESRIANKIKELASKIGELVKLEHDKEERERERKRKNEEQKEDEGDEQKKEEEEKQKKEEILAMFKWLTGDKSGISCTFNKITLSYGTCHRKKMIYYYIAIHLLICFRKFILKDAYEEDTTIYDNLIAKFEKHKEKRKSAGMIWRREKEEKEFISGISEKLYNSIFKEEEKGFVVVNTNKVMMAIPDIPEDELRPKWDKNPSKLVEFIAQLKNLKIKIRMLLQKSQDWM